MYLSKKGKAGKLYHIKIIKGEKRYSFIGEPHVNLEIDPKIGKSKFSINNIPGVYFLYIYIYILFLIATRHDFGFNIEKIPKNDLPKQKKLETSDDKPEEKGDSEPNLK